MKRLPHGQKKTQDKQLAIRNDRLRTLHLNHTGDNIVLLKLFHIFCPLHVFFSFCFNSCIVNKYFIVLEN